MHYYIDGYNLLFRMLKAGDEVRKQREEITFELERKIGLLELDATLVFDSHYHESESTRSHFKSLEIIFTDKNQTADEFILHELKNSKNPSQHTVVTSDKKLANLCKLRLAHTESVEEFLTWLGKRYKNKLRQNRPETKPLPPLAKLSELKKPEPIPPPTPKDAAESLFDFYLDTFNKEVESFEPPPTPPKTPQEPKPKAKKPKPPEEQISDHDRWLKAFEKKIL